VTAEIVEGRKEMYLRIAINPFIVILTILAITVILNLGLSIPSPETLTSFYDIYFQPITAINYSKLCATVGKSGDPPSLQGLDC
jgi:hypothetical protein